MNGIILIVIALLLLGIDWWAISMKSLFNLNPTIFKIVTIVSTTIGIIDLSIVVFINPNIIVRLQLISIVLSANLIYLGVASFIRHREYKYESKRINFNDSALNQFVKTNQNRIAQLNNIDLKHLEEILNSKENSQKTLAKAKSFLKQKG